MVSETQLSAQGPRDKTIRYKSYSHTWVNTSELRKLEFIFIRPRTHHFCLVLPCLKPAPPPAPLKVLKVLKPTVSREFFWNHSIKKWSDITSPFMLNDHMFDSISGCF